MSVHVVSSQPEGLSRAGFVVSKAVGGAVTRNLVKRRLRSIAQASEGLAGIDVVVRAHPASADATYSALSAEFERLVSKVSM